jgi:hypothetical protein
MAPGDVMGVQLPPQGLPAAPGLHQAFSLVRILRVGHNPRRDLRFQLRGAQRCKALPHVQGMLVQDIVARMAFFRWPG